MLKRIRKKALTMVELSAVIFIIGIVIAAGISTVKPFERVLNALYYKAYNSLSTAVYNINVDTSEIKALPLDFCNQLIGYINTAQTSCNANAASLLANDFSDTNLQFTSTNGMKFYISPRVKYVMNVSGTNYDNWYRIVFVDLNGPSKPNSVSNTGGQADIVGFVITDDATVIPIGQPTIDTKYIRASVCYPNTDPNLDDICGYTTSFFNAVNIAYGPTVQLSESYTYTFNNDTNLNGSPLKITYPTPPAYNTINKCGATATSSACYVNFEAQ